MYIFYFRFSSNPKKLSLLEGLQTYFHFLRQFPTIRQKDQYKYLHEKYYLS